ncbi:MAG TPA: winged helix-turn-helix domain-containing protein [Nitrososphaeraceae archaeon]|jgi:predicted transcriptional regulator|nr:winged helix-turn-helix domain-containing protein [Nitrososphaeraceae archaeon]
MTSVKDDDEDIHHKIITEILNICTDGCTEQKIMEQMQLSHDQLRRIMAEIVDNEFLHYIEARHIYLTTDQGYIFLKKKNRSLNNL